MYYNPRPFPI